MITCIVILLSIDFYFRCYSYNIISIFYGISFNFCFFLFIFNLFFLKPSKSFYIFIIYIIFSFLISAVITIYTWNNRILLLLKTPIKNGGNNLILHEQFEFIFECYDTINFEKIFIDLSFYNKLNEDDKRLLNSNKFYCTSLMEDDSLISEMNNKRFEKSYKNFSKKKEKLFFILSIMNENFKKI